MFASLCRAGTKQDHLVTGRTSNPRKEATAVNNRNTIYIPYIPQPRTDLWAELADATFDHDLPRARTSEQRILEILAAS